MTTAAAAAAMEALLVGVEFVWNDQLVVVVLTTGILLTTHTPQQRCGVCVRVPSE